MQICLRKFKHEFAKHNRKNHRQRLGRNRHACYLLIALHQTQTIPGIGIEVLVFWPVLVLVLVLKIPKFEVLVLVLVLKN